jgi:hypothetical protein
MHRALAFTPGSAVGSASFLSQSREIEAQRGSGTLPPREAPNEDLNKVCVSQGS